MSIDNQPLIDIPPAETAAGPTDKPKAKRGPGRPRRPDRAPDAPTLRPGKYKQPVMGLYGTIGMAVSLARPGAGMAIMQQAESCAIAWDKAARQNPSIRRVLDAALTTSTWSELLIAHVPIVLAILGDAGMLSGSPLEMFAGVHATAPPAPSASTPANETQAA